jgi:DNA-binding CsgD family transcriptional regulator
MQHGDEAVERLAQALLRLHSPAPPSRAGERIAEALALAVDGDLALHVAVDPALNHAQASVWPRGVRLPPVDAAVIERERALNPLVRWLAADRSLRAWRLVDVASVAGMSGAGGEAPPWGTLPVRYQMVMRLASPDGRLHAAVLARGRAEFDDGERRRVELMWPHLVQRLRDARRAVRHGRGAAPGERGRAERGIVLLDDDLQVLLATEQARLWLGEYFGAQTSMGLALPPVRPWLPPAVLDWVRRRVEGERLAMREPVIDRDPLVCQRGDRCLVVDLVVDLGRGEHLLTLVEEALAAPTSALGGLGLTARETEVLSWVAQGKTNREIGMILGASERTVQKHLERVFQKLGVESRTAATLKAWQTARYAMLGKPG